MFQKMIVVGNLGSDPEMRYLPSGTAVANFSVASNRSWTNDNGEREERTTWFRVSVFGKQAETVNQYLSKGRQVLVEGRLDEDPQTGGPRVFERHDGSCGASYEIIALNVTFLGTGGGSPQRVTEPVAEVDSYDDGLDDDIPF